MTAANVSHYYFNPITQTYSEDEDKDALKIYIQTERHIPKPLLTDVVKKVGNYAAIVSIKDLLNNIRWRPMLMAGNYNLVDQEKTKFKSIKDRLEAIVLPKDIKFAYKFSMTLENEDEVTARIIDAASKFISFLARSQQAAINE